MSQPDHVPEGPPDGERGARAPRPSPADDTLVASLDLGTMAAAQPGRTARRPAPGPDAPGPHAPGPPQQMAPGGNGMAPVPGPVPGQAPGSSPGDRTPPGGTPPGGNGSGTAGNVPDRDTAGTPDTSGPGAADARSAGAGAGLEASGWSALQARLTGVSLRGRLVSILLAALFIALAVSGYATQLVLRSYLVSQVDAQLQSNAAAAAHSTAEALDRGESQVLIPWDYAVRLRSLDGTVRATLTPLRGPKPNWPAAESMPNTSDLDGSRVSAPFEITGASDRTRWRAVTVVTRGLSGPYLADVALPLTHVDRTVLRLRLYVLIAGLLVAAGCTLLGWLAIRRAFVPLVEVEDTAAAIAAGDLSRRVPERPPSTEVGRLTSSLNGMLNQIERAFRAREASEARTRRFAADASHELRTPLAAIRGFAELYRQGAVPADEVGHTMRRIEGEATRMGGLVEDLLLLARLDEQRPGRTEPVDLAVLAGDAVHDARALDPTRRVGLLGLGTAGGPSPAVVTGDEDRLRQVVANLVANAVRHTPNGTPIEVAVGVMPPRPEAPSAAVLEVRDHGPGLAPDQAERVFERFYRVDGSRTRTQGGGSGLGLSIVAAVVAAHGGRVQPLPTPGGGATFRVEIPADRNGQGSAAADPPDRREA